jgi:hypothetical protein
MSREIEVLKHLALTHFLSTALDPAFTSSHARLSIHLSQNGKQQQGGDKQLGKGCVVKYKSFHPQDHMFCFPVRVIYCHATQAMSYALHKRLSLAIKQTRTANVSWQFTNVDQAMYRHAQYDTKLQRWLAGCVGTYKTLKEKKKSTTQTVIVLVAPTVSDCERRKSRLNALKLLPDTLFILVPYGQPILKDSADEIARLIAQSMRQHSHVFGSNHDMLSVVVMMPQMDILNTNTFTPSALPADTGLEYDIGNHVKQGKPSLRSFLQTAYSKVLTSKLSHLLANDTVSEVRWRRSPCVQFTLWNLNKIKNV